MKEATIIYPHQLFHQHPAISAGRVVYLVEEPLFLTEFPIHNQKLLLHRLAMQSYKKELTSTGHKVVYLEIQDLGNTADVFSILKQDQITQLHIVDTTDHWLELRINEAAVKYDFELIRYESPLFILPKSESILRYKKSGKHLARFYKQLRIDHGILVNNAKEPEGGKWSFDSSNRKKLPKDFNFPPEIETHQTNDAMVDAQIWLKSVPAERYGESSVWVPYTRNSALKYLEEFITQRLSSFGDYEDAISTKQTRLFHSTLSPLMNIGLLSPQEVVSAVIDYGQQNNIALNNIEGFVRQVIGWREFIRASYECDGVKMRTRNFFKNKKSLPPAFWSGTTGIPPLDISIKRALDYGYNHHIERLMVLGNFMLLSKISPDEVYRWFMAMYVDAYDWVMVPNVYGMSQFADGGIFATKPYISGSSYLKKMSDYESGEWEELWTALYWNFINEHKDFFLGNHRLSMMPRLLEKMSSEKKDHYLKTAHEYLKSL